MATPTAVRLDEIEKSSAASETIGAVKRGIYSEQWNELAMPFKIFASELCFSGNILLRGTRIVVPEELRERVIAAAHEGHPGICVMKRRLRTKVWWPKIDQQAEKFVQKCHGCTLVSAPAAPEPLRRTTLPSEPWQHLAIDFLGPLPSGHNLLVLVDFFSRYIEIEVMKIIDSTETIRRLRKIFARFGLPLSITADNGRQFISDEFKSYCNTNNIKLINIIPYWPQQNGEVERQNRSILKRLTISQNTGGNWMDDLQEYLLMYRATPHSTTFKTPAEMLFGRNIRDKIPHIHQPLETDEAVKDRDREKKEKERMYADKRRGARETDIEVGDEVLAKRQVKTNKLSSTFGPERYKVVMRKGSEAVIEQINGQATYRRNVSHLKRLFTDSTLSTGQTAPATGPSTNQAASDIGSSSKPEINTRDGPTTRSMGRQSKRPAYLADYVHS